MGIKTPRAVAERSGSATSPAKDAGVGSSKRILCRLCRTGELRLYMCGPRLRGRCRSLRHRVRVSVVLLSTGLVSMDE